MFIISSAKTKYLNGFDISYVVKFILCLVVLYYFNIFFIAITDTHGKFYSSFLDQHLNYISWIRNSILYTSNIITHAFGINTYVHLPYQLRVINGAAVEMVYSCIGLGLISFWIAYIISHTSSAKAKIVWCLIGVASIWLSNIFRIALLLTAVQKHWKVNNFIDHHTLFNICIYLLIVFLMYLYSKTSKKTAGSFQQKNN